MRLYINRVDFYCVKDVSNKPFQGRADLSTNEYRIYQGKQYYYNSKTDKVKLLGKDNPEFFYVLPKDSDTLYPVCSVKFEDKLKATDPDAMSYYLEGYTREGWQRAIDKRKEHLAKIDQQMKEREEEAQKAYEEKRNKAKAQLEDVRSLSQNPNKPLYKIEVEDIETWKDFGLLRFPISLARAIKGMAFIEAKETKLERYGRYGKASGNSYQKILDIVLEGN